MESRSDKVIKNSIVGVIMQVAVTIISFFARTIFIRLLGENYLGINGLFTSILSILSLAELGVGSAIVYRLYKPISDKDEQKIVDLMSLYKKCYFIIGIVIFFLGILLLPVIKYMVDFSQFSNLNIYIVYLLFLLNTSLTYPFSYKSSLIEANQKKFINDIILNISLIIKEFILIFVLFYTENYYFYLIFMILFNLLGYFVINCLTNKMYPFLKLKPQKIEKQEIMSIFKDIFFLMVYKICWVVLDGTDNILISSFFGVSMVGILSNYLLIKTTLKTLIDKVSSSFLASTANYLVENKQNSKKLLYKIFCILSLLFGLSAIGIYSMINDIVIIWLGKDYLLDKNIVFAIALYFYVDGSSYVIYIFRTSLGYFKDCSISPILCSIINVVLSIILGKRYGVFGILIATTIARMTTYFIFDPHIIFKKTFNETPFKYYLYFLFTLIYVLLIGYINNEIVNNIFDQTFIGLVLKFVFTFVFVNIWLLIYFVCNKYFRELIFEIVRKIKNVFNR